MRLPGSTGVSPVGFGVSPKRSFCNAKFMSA
jgi:hypothetical protein